MMRVPQVLAVYGHGADDPPGLKGKPHLIAGSVEPRGELGEVRGDQGLELGAESCLSCVVAGVHLGAAPQCSGTVMRSIYVVSASRC